MQAAIVIAIVCPVAATAVGIWFDRLGPIDGLLEEWLFSTWPMAAVGAALGALVAASA